MDSYEILMTQDATDDLTELRNYITERCIPNKTEAKQLPSSGVTRTSYNAASVLKRKSIEESALAALAATSDSELATTQ